MRYVYLLKFGHLPWRAFSSEIKAEHHQLKMKEGGSPLTTITKLDLE